MSFLYNNIAAFAVALAASLMAWLFGGARGDVLLPVMPWIFAFLLEVVFCFPQRRGDETIYDARDRVWKDLRRSPVFLTAFGLFVLLQIPFVNNGLCKTCDAALIAQGLSAAPPVDFLPSCVNRIEHLHVVLWFSIALLSLVAVNLCLTRSGKRLVLELIVWNGAALAALAFVQSATKAPGPFWQTLPDGRSYGDFFGTFGYPNMAGDYFTLLFGLSVALWRQRCDHLNKEDRSLDASELAGKEKSRRDNVFWRRHYFVLPSAVFFFAALNTLSRAAIILVTTLAVLFFLHTLWSLLSRMKKSRRVFVGVWSLLAFGLLVFFSSISMPKKIHKEVDTLDSIAMLDRVTGRGQYHTTVAMGIWKDNKLFGCGGWGYKHLCGAKMRELEIDPKNMQDIGGINVHNDYLQFLAEHGLVGFGAMVALAILLLWPVFRQWKGIARGFRFKKGKELPPKPIVIFALPGPAFFILLTCLASLVHAFGDCPFRSGAVLTLFYIALASLPGFMPKPSASEPQVGRDAPIHSHHHHHHHKKGEEE